MEQPLRITGLDVSLADALRRRLRAFDPQPRPVDDHVELEIVLRERNPEHRINHLLETVDAWLVASGVPAVEVQLDGITYTLHAQTHEKAHA